MRKIKEKQENRQFYNRANTKITVLTAKALIYMQIVRSAGESGAPKQALFAEKRGERQS